MIRVVERRFLALCIFVAAFVTTGPFIVMSAEPTVEVNPEPSSSVTLPTDTGSDDSSSLSLPHIPLTISLSAHGGYDDNFRTLQQSKGSWYTNGGGSLLYDLPTRSNHFSLRAGADVTYFLDHTNGRKDSINAYISTSLIRNVSERLKLAANAYATYRTEPDFGSNVGLDTRQGNFFRTLDDVSASYHWTKRFWTVTSDKFQLVQYDTSSGIAGSVNRLEDTAGQEFKYDLFHANNTLVAEYRFEVIDYDTSPRDSITQFALAGLDEQFTQDLKGSVRGGVTSRSYTSGREETDPRFESSLSYAGAHHSTLSWRASYGIEEPSSADVLSRTTFRTGLELKYGLTARITATVSGYYHHDENRGVLPSSSTGMPMSRFSEDAFDISTNVKYAINRRFTFDLGLQYSEINSQEASRNYSRYRAFSGLTFTY